MTKIVPFKKAFKNQALMDKITNFILWISTILMITDYCLKLADQKYTFIIPISAIFMAMYIILTLISFLGFHSASYLRVSDFIDNSFNVSLSAKKSKEYFSNDLIEPGIYKMGVNCFENVLFTYNISSKMINVVLTKAALFSLIIITLAIVGLNNHLILLIQLTLPALVILNGIKHIIFVHYAKRVFEDFRVLFNNIKVTKTKKHATSIIIFNVIKYEKLLSSYTISLDSKIFEKLNETLSAEWDKIKEEYSLDQE